MFGQGLLAAFFQQKVEDPAGGQAPGGAVDLQYHTHGAGHTHGGGVVDLLAPDADAQVAGDQQGDGGGDGQHRLEQGHQGQHEQGDEAHDPEDARATVDGVHGAAAIAVALGKRPPGNQALWGKVRPKGGA